MALKNFINFLFKKQLFNRPTDSKFNKRINITKYWLRHQAPRNQFQEIRNLNLNIRCGIFLESSDICRWTRTSQIRIGSGVGRCNVRIYETKIFSRDKSGVCALFRIQNQTDDWWNLSNKKGIFQIGSQGFNFSWIKQNS